MKPPVEVCPNPLLILLQPGTAGLKLWDGSLVAARQQPRAIQLGQERLVGRPNRPGCPHCRHRPHRTRGQRGQAGLSFGQHRSDLQGVPACRRGELESTLEGFNCLRKQPARDSECAVANQRKLGVQELRSH